MIHAAAEHLALSADESPSGGADEIVPFKQWAMEFNATGAALRLRGTADAPNDGALLTAAARPLLTSPQNHSVEGVALLRTLLPDKGDN